MTILLLIALFTPLLGALIISLFGQQKEKRIASLTFATLLVYDLAVASLILTWMYMGFKPLEIMPFELYHHGVSHFSFPLYFDDLGAVFLGVTAYIGSIIVRFSRYYMHRENGFQSFFATILSFLFGLNLLILSGSLEILFAGWEIVGLASFLLISFYRSRVPSVENAFRVFVVYRICDVGLLASAWMSHYLWHESLAFGRLTQLLQPEHLITISPSLLLVFGLLILLAAIGKSAQFPFCYWLPRSMEGPTPSSAIFYGALSIHAGVFLLLRMYPLWQAIPGLNWLVGIEGAVSMLVATLCGRAQSNIKGQIAYASITQVGIMLVEMALGFPRLALLHFAANASLRCYQLLVSPSAVVHLLKLQGQGAIMFKPRFWSLDRILPSRYRNSLYLLALHEAFLLPILSRLVAPLLWLGHRIHHHPPLKRQILAYQLLLTIIVVHIIFPSSLMVPLVGCGFLAMASSLSALTERSSARQAWHDAGFSAIVLGIMVILMDGALDADVGLYFVGIVPAWLLGLWLLRSLESSLPNTMGLKSHHGLAILQPSLGSRLLFLLLMLATFPIGPAFLGEDLLLQHAGHHAGSAVILLIVGFVLNGISLMRLYARVCYGKPRLLQPAVAGQGKQWLSETRLTASTQSLAREESYNRAAP